MYTSITHTQGNTPSFCLSEISYRTNLDSGSEVPSKVIKLLPSPQTSSGTESKHTPSHPGKRHRHLKYSYCKHSQFNTGIKESLLFCSGKLKLQATFDLDLSLLCSPKTQKTLTW